MGTGEPDMTKNTAPAQAETTTETAPASGEEPTTVATTAQETAQAPAAPAGRRIAWDGLMTLHPTAPSVQKLQGYKLEMRADAFHGIEPDGTTWDKEPAEGKARATYLLLARLADDLDSRLADEAETWVAESAITFSAALVARSEKKPGLTLAEMLASRKAQTPAQETVQETTQTQE
jgi:hypothetical protein